MKDEEKKYLGLTDFDIFELYQRCVETFVDTCSRLDIDKHRCFDLGQVLWEKSIEARDKYRKGYPDKEAKR